jgi:hypothetical protein
VYSERLVIVVEGQTVYEHARIIDRSHRKPGRVIHDWRHYLALAIVREQGPQSALVERQRSAESTICKVVELRGPMNGFAAYAVAKAAIRYEVNARACRNKSSGLPYWTKARYLVEGVP